MARKVSKEKPPKGQWTKAGGSLDKTGVSRDARSKIISKQRSKMTDARDRLVSLTKKSGDARKRLEKIRNLKMGKLDVKTTSKGRITITTTTQGKTLLTTKRKESTSVAAAAKDKAQKQGKASDRGRNKTVTRTVGRGGIVSLRTKGKINPTLTGVAKRKSKPASGSAPPLAKELTRTIKGRMSDAAKLDMELMNTKVDPVILKRTVNNDSSRRRQQQRRPSPYSYSRSASPPPDIRYRSRSRSPLNGYGGGRGVSRYHYDDPRREEGYARQLQRLGTSYLPSQAPTMADRFDATGGGYGSPLEGAKVVVSNLSDTVSRDDIVELFGDVGALKRAKVATPGMAEVVFVNRSDAQKAVEIYHNRQLDGKAMRCQIVGSARLEASNGGSSALKLLSGGGSSSRKDYRISDSRPHSGMPVEINSIHRALFSDRKPRSGRDERSGGSASCRRSRY